MDIKDLTIAELEKELRDRRRARNREIFLTFTVEVEMVAEQIWPDGNIPEYFDKNTILNEVYEDGGARRVLLDWELLEGKHDVTLEIEVH